MTVRPALTQEDRIKEAESTASLSADIRRDLLNATVSLRARSSHLVSRLSQVLPDGEDGEAVGRFRTLIEEGVKELAASLGALQLDVQEVASGQSIRLAVTQSEHKAKNAIPDGAARSTLRAIRIAEILVDRISTSEEKIEAYQNHLAQDSARIQEKKGELNRILVSSTEASSSEARALAQRIDHLQGVARDTEARISEKREKLSKQRETLFDYLRSVRVESTDIPEGVTFEDADALVRETQVSIVGSLEKTIEVRRGPQVEEDRPMRRIWTTSRLLGAGVATSTLLFVSVWYLQPDRPDPFLVMSRDDRSTTSLFSGRSPAKLSEAESGLEEILDEYTVPFHAWSNGRVATIKVADDVSRAIRRRFGQDTKIGLNFEFPKPQGIVTALSTDDGAVAAEATSFCGGGKARITLDLRASTGSRFTLSSREYDAVGVQSMLTQGGLCGLSKTGQPY